MTKFISLIENIEELVKGHRLFGVEIFNIFKPRIILYDSKIFDKVDSAFSSSIKTNLRRYIYLILNKLVTHKPIILGRNIDILVLGFSVNHYNKNLAPILATVKVNSFCISAGYSDIGDLYSVWRYYKCIPNEYYISANASYLKFKNYLLSDEFFKKLIERNPHLNHKNLKNYIKVYLLDDFTRLLPLFIVNKYIFDVLNPSKIVTTDEIDQRCRFILSLAKNKGIESICVQQGAASPNYMEWRHSISDHVLVFGEETKQILMAQGVSTSRICVVGNPAYDHLPYSKATEEFYLFASQPYYEGTFASPDDRCRMLSDMVNIFVENSQHMLLIKPHPHEGVNEWNWIKGKYSNIQVRYDLDISTEIANCCVFITFYSTCTYEAILHNKPIICIQYLNSILVSNPFASPIVDVASDVNELRELITKFSSSGVKNLYAYGMSAERKQFIRRNLFSNDRQSCKRAAALIERDL